MPPLVIGATIAAGAAFGGSALSAHASSKAAQEQEQASQKALDFSKQIYADQSQRLSPFVNLGTNALQGYQNYASQPFGARLASLGQPYNPRTAAGGPAAVPSAPAPGAYGLGNGAPAPGGGSGPLVTVIDDSGAQRQVPAAQAAIYQQRGFRVLGGGGGLPPGPQPIAGGPMSPSAAYMG